MQNVSKKNRLKRWLQSTSRRTFILYPVCIVSLELIIHRGGLIVVPWGIPLLAWGYLQYHFSGRYRIQHGGGGPGLEIPPTHVVSTGIYAFTRNPMYLGHLVFLTGLAITFWSILGLVLLVVNIVWFHSRVLRDEAQMKQRFGSVYSAYMSRVKRWIPGVS